MMLFTCVYVHDCATVITTVCSCVNAGFVHHIVQCTEYVKQASLTSSLQEDGLQWDNRTFKQENGLLARELNNSLLPFFL